MIEAEGIANRDHPLRPRARRRSCPTARPAGGRYVSILISAMSVFSSRPITRALNCAAVLQCDDDALGVFDHVIVGQNETVGADDKARAEAVRMRRIVVNERLPETVAGSGPRRAPDGRTIRFCSVATLTTAGDSLAASSTKSGSVCHLVQVAGRSTVSVQNGAADAILALSADATTHAVIHGRRCDLRLHNMSCWNSRAARPPSARCRARSTYFIRNSYRIASISCASSLLEVAAGFQSSSMPMISINCCAPTRSCCGRPLCGSGISPSNINACVESPTRNVPNVISAACAPACA